jgi:hypothetical protein
MCRLRPEEGPWVVVGVLLDPALIVLGALGQDLLGDFGLVADLPEEIGHVVFTGQEGEVSVDDDAVEAMITPLQIRLKKLKKQLHGRPFFEFLFEHSNSKEGPHALQAPEPAQPFN